MDFFKELVCLYCSKEIIKEDYSMVAVEKPYCNLFFHSDCIKKVGDMLCFLTENLEKWYNIGEK